MSSVFTVYFDGQFWIGVLEIRENGEVRASRHVFGAEPTGAQLYEFGLRDFGRLLDAAESSIPAPASSRPRTNPKRVARLVSRERAAPSLSTAAQDAMRLSIEAGAQRRRSLRKEADTSSAQRKREQRRREARDRHRGTG